MGQMNMHHRHKLKVLIVEDSKIIASRIKNMIRDDKNITVVGEAKDHGEAMNLMESKTPHVVLLDFKLPGIGGVDVLKEIKQKYISTKVIMVTGHYEPCYRKVCKKAGADFFFDKATEFEKIPGVLIS